MVSVAPSVVITVVTTAAVEVGSAEEPLSVVVGSAEEEPLSVVVGSAEEELLSVAVGSAEEEPLSVEVGSELLFVEVDSAEELLSVVVGSAEEELLSVEVGSAEEEPLSVVVGSAEEELLSVEVGSAEEELLSVEVGSAEEELLSVEVGSAEEEEPSLPLSVAVGSAEEEELSLLLSVGVGSAGADEDEPPSVGVGATEEVESLFPPSPPSAGEVTCAREGAEGEAAPAPSSVGAGGTTVQVLPAKTVVTPTSARVMAPAPRREMTEGSGLAWKNAGLTAPAGASGTAVMTGAERRLMAAALTKTSNETSNKNM
jgi:hypothetical protein